MKGRKTEMSLRMEYELQYIEQRQENRLPVDWARVTMGFTQAFASGIKTGDCGPNCVVEMPEMSIEDQHFKILISALTEGKKNKPEGITLKFPDSNLTDNSLQALAHELLNPDFPQHVTIDLSHSARITKNGITTLLAALSDEKCNLSVKIKLPNLDAVLTEKFNAQLAENQRHYVPKQVKEKHKVTRGGLFKSKPASDAKPKKAKAEKAEKPKKAAKPPRKSLLSGKSKTVKDKDEKKRVYTRQNSR